MDLIFIFVEGNDDKRFIEDIVIPYITVEKQITIKAIPYQQKTNKKINKTVKSYVSKNYNFIFLTDLDSHSYPCITSRKAKRMAEYSSLNNNNIIIVNEEIESWYIAGMDNSKKEFMNFNIPNNTEDIKKEDLDQMIEDSSFDSKIDFYKELSKNFNFDLALKRNKSLKYFINKLKLLV